VSSEFERRVERLRGDMGVPPMRVAWNKKMPVNMLFFA
jgi:hypothetical protein